MTAEEQELLEKRLPHRRVLGEDGRYPNLDSWRQEVRYSRGPSAQGARNSPVWFSQNIRYPLKPDKAALFGVRPGPGRCWS